MQARWAERAPGHSLAPEVGLTDCSPGRRLVTVGGDKAAPQLLTILGEPLLDSGSWKSRGEGGGCHLFHAAHMGYSSSFKLLAFL